MPVTVDVRFRNREPVSGALVRLIAPAPRGRFAERLDRGRILAQGTTASDGSVRLDTRYLTSNEQAAFAVVSADTGDILHATHPVRVPELPRSVVLELDESPFTMQLERLSDELTQERPEEPEIPDRDPGLPSDDSNPTDPLGPGPQPEEQPAGPPRRPYPQILADRLVREGALKQAEAEVIGTFVNERFSQLRDGYAKAESLLGQKPVGMVPSSHFVPQGQSLEARLSNVIGEGVDRISRATIEQGRGIPVQPGPVADLLPEAGGVVTPDVLSQILALVMPGNQATSRMSPLEKCRSRERAQTEVARIDSAAGKESSGDDVARSSSAPSNSQGSGNIDAVVAALGDADVMATRPTVADIAGSLQTEIPSGPADTTSYYDFHRIQVAWEDTWTGMVDSNLVAQVQELYDSVVETMPEDANFEDIYEEVDDLNELLDTLNDAASAVSSAILSDSQLSAWIPEIGEKWNDLTPLERDKLGFLYDVHLYVTENHTLHDYQYTIDGWVDVPNTIPLATLDKFKDYPVDWLPSDLTVHGAHTTGWAEAEANSILNGVVESTGASIGRVEDLISGLKDQIAEPYQFDVFAAGSYNFGLITTYRQEWQPVTYQAGDLAGTIALAPNETRRYKVRRKVTRSFESNRERSSLDAQTSEITDTARTEGEIMRRVQSDLSASANASIGFDLGITFNGGGQFGLDQTIESNQTKRDIRESTRTAAQEFRDERKVEISEKHGFESEVSEEREIANPNNELTVTYFFYELQRRFQVAERLYDVKPVVLVAFEVPTPDQINEAWLLKYEWILRKVLLDPSLHPVLRSLSQSFAGDEVALEVYEEQWKLQIAIVGDIREQVEGHVELRDAARAAIQRAAQAAQTAAANAEGKDSTSILDVALVATGGVGALLADELLEKVSSDPAADTAITSTAQDRGRQALDWADTDLASAKAALHRGIAALEVATERYVQAVRQQLNRRIKIDKLILHVKSNITHYMQAIWRHEHPDERYLRLYDMEVVWPDWSEPFNYAPAQVPGYRRRSIPQVGGGQTLQQGGMLIPGAVSTGDTRKLHQVADLSDLLGFKGNYAIFPLREPNALTTTMAIDYLDTEFGVRDPDQAGGAPTAEEAIEIAECAWNAPNITESEKQEIAEWLVQALEDAHSASQEIVVPTGELAIEALPGSHPLLEDFKLRHRAYDAANAAAQARIAELEALRHAARLKASELGDPDVDKRIEITSLSGDLNLNVEE